MKLTHPKWRRFKRRMSLEKFTERLARIIFAEPTQGEVRMKTVNVDRQVHGKQRFIDLLAELKESRMAIPDPGPHHFGSTPRRKNTDGSHGQDERFHPDPLQRGDKPLLAGRINGPNVTEREMNVFLRNHPQFIGRGGEVGELGLNRRRRSYRDKEAGHTPG